MAFSDFIEKTIRRGRKKERQQGYKYHTYSTKFKDEDCNILILKHYRTKILEFDLENEELIYFRSTSKSDSSSISEALRTICNEPLIKGKQQRRKTFYVISGDGLLEGLYKKQKNSWKRKFIRKNLWLNNGEKKLNLISDDVDKIVGYAGNKKDNYFVVKADGKYYGWKIKDRSRKRLKVASSNDGEYLFNRKYRTLATPEKQMKDKEIKEYGSEIVGELL